MDEPTKIFPLILVQEYPQPSLEIEEAHPKDQHPHTYQDREADAGRQKFSMPKNCT